MNRISSYLPENRIEAALSNPLLKAASRMRKDAEATLRDMAYVLALTQRVKAEILEGSDHANA
ncbi:MAG: hypothetical protein K2X38_22350 [Gemmataceae bacterium]|nr:hypothetical protein [Gemmataceae bacterium]